MRLLHLFILTIGILILVACAPTPLNGDPSSELTLVDCPPSAVGSTNLHSRARCGSLEVFEDRRSASGRKINLNIAIIPAVSRSPAPDPLFFLAGGPGEAATQSYASVAAAFERINQKHDIVLVDQRGTGKSHPLKCEIPDDTEDTPADSPERSDEERLAAILQDCLAKLDADPRFYTTALAMDDLDQVRAALGYDQINLYGASYGTRAALAYLRQYPQHTRTVMLDGAAPPNWNLGPTVAVDAQRTLGLIFARCAAEPACQASFPDLPAEFDAILERLAQNPIEVALEHPLSGEPLTYTLSSESFASSIHTLSYTPETVVLIPFLIHNGYENDDFSRLVSIALSTSGVVQDSISNGLRFSVICAEDVPFYPSEDPPASSSYMGDFIPRSFRDICTTWPHGDIPADFKDPVRSDRPVLIISGQNDPVTPPANGDLAAQTLDNSLHLVAPGMGHINIFRGCIPQIVASFVDQASFQNIDTACVDTIAPMPLFVNINGPIP